MAMDEEIKVVYIDYWFFYVSTFAFWEKKLYLFLCLQHELYQNVYFNKNVNSYVFLPGLFRVNYYFV